MSSPSAFAIWITGLPASGKSTITRTLVEKLKERGVQVAVLESDVLRHVLADEPRYEEDNRDPFYRAMVWIGTLLVEHGVSVVFDATANLGRYRERARTEIPRYLEVYVDTSLTICIDRDPKGIYQNAMEGEGDSVPGLGAAYEPPENPDVIVAGDTETPEQSAGRILDALRARGYLAE